MTAFLSQLRTDLKLTMRQGEQLLVSFGIPLGILVFFSQVEVFSPDNDTQINVLTPGVIAIAVMSTALVSLGIGTGFERYYGVLKRLGASPLGRGRWVAAKVAQVTIIEMVQVALIVLVAFALGWEPRASGVGAAVVAGLLGTIALGGIALTMAGRLSGPLNLALCNALFLVLLATSGMTVPYDELPHAVRSLAVMLPAAPLADLLSGALTSSHTSHSESWIVLTIWAVAAPAMAVATFRWNGD